MARPSTKRLLLSPPDVGDVERKLLMEAFDSNWIAPTGPQVDAFEAEFAESLGGNCHALALASGTAAIHLALRVLDVTTGDDVLCSTFTFIASAAPILYLGARPVFIDSNRQTWNMDPELLAETLERRAREGRRPKAVLVVHLFGQCADLEPIVEACDRHGVSLIEDAAEAVGAKYKNRPAGRFGQLAAFSFNGNKIITTSGGGMLVSDDAALIAKARFLSTQAKDPAPHYEHSQFGYNYRLSNLLAAIGRGQLRGLARHIEARRRNYQHYRRRLGVLPGIAMMPEYEGSFATFWLSCLTIDSDQFGATPGDIRKALDAEAIESRPLWKPMHLQPVFADAECVGGAISSDLFARGICLPSGSAMSVADLERVCDAVERAHELGAKA